MLVWERRADDKTAMADRLAARTDLSNAVAGVAVDGVFAAIGETLANAEEVRITGSRTSGARKRTDPYRTQSEDRRSSVSVSATSIADTQGRGRRSRMP